MDWELQEENDDGTEFWICGKKVRNEENCWSFVADVSIDNLRDRSEIEMDVFTLPRHIVEDCGWKNLDQAMEDMKVFTNKIEKLNKISKKHKVEIFSDEFVGFKTSVRVGTSDKKEIEKKIVHFRRLLQV